MTAPKGFHCFCKLDTMPMHKLHRNAVEVEVEGISFHIEFKVFSWYSNGI